MFYPSNDSSGAVFKVTGNSQQMQRRLGVSTSSSCTYVRYGTVLFVQFVRNDCF